MMIFNIEKLNKKQLLQLLIDVEERWQTGFIDTDAAQRQIRAQDAEDRQRKLAELLAQSGFSKEEWQRHLQQESAPQTAGVKTVTLNSQQQQILKRNLDREVDSKLQALLDKYNIR